MSINQMHRKLSSIDINTKISNKHIKYWREFKRQTDGRVIWFGCRYFLWYEKRSRKNVNFSRRVSVRILFQNLRIKKHELSYQPNKHWTYWFKWRAQRSSVTHHSAAGLYIVNTWYLKFYLSSHTQQYPSKSSNNDDTLSRTITA